MSAAAPGFDLWPYVVVLLLGVLPNGVWRMLGVFAARGLSEDAEILVWVRYVAAALVAGVVAQLLFVPSGALAAVPAAGRFGALAAAAAAYAAAGRRVSVGLPVGLIVLAAAAQFFGGLPGGK